VSREMWEPRRLTNLWLSMTCYRDSLLLGLGLLKGSYYPTIRVEVVRRKNTKYTVEMTSLQIFDTLIFQI
jgi:hypothetical protein